MKNIDLSSLTSNDLTITTATTTDFIATSTGTDPILYKTSLSIAGSSYRYVAIRAKLTYTGTDTFNNIGEIYYGISTDSTFSYTRKAQFQIIADSHFHVYVIDMWNATYTSGGAWNTNTIPSIRVDFGNNNNLNIEITFWHISVEVPNINSTINKTSFTNTIYIDKINLEEMRTAISNLNIYLEKVDNCGNCYADTSVLCQTCQTCQACQSSKCQTCQTTRCQQQCSCQGY